MKKILALTLSAILLFCTVSCAAKPQNIMSEGEYTGSGPDPTQFNLDAAGNASPFDHMSKTAFRTNLRPYLEAWYKFCYNAMWWQALELSENEEDTIENEVGDIYIKAADFNTQGELIAYLSTWLAPELFNKNVGVMTIENDSGLYILENVTGRYGTPDYNSCELIGVNSGKYYIRFVEENELFPEEDTAHVIAFEIINGKLLVTRHLSYAEALNITVGKLLDDGVVPEIMSLSEFKSFAAMLLYNYAKTHESLIFDEDSAKLCTEEWTKTVEGASCVAEILINGKNHYVIIGKDINKTYNIIGIQQIIPELS